MLRTKPFAALFCTLTLVACATAEPSGPDVLALPPAGKSLAQFQQDDLACRSYARQQIDASPAQAADRATVAGAAAGTAVGAAGGAALGAAAGGVGTGAAIGAATGLLAGTAIGADSAAVSAAVLQRRYDMSYAQCMAAYGNQVQAMAAVLPYEAYAYPYPYAWPPYYDPWLGPFAGVSFFGVFSPHFHHHGFHHFAHHGHSHRA